MPEVLALAAYATPVLFGLGMYLLFVRRPQPLESAAVSWAVGWAVVNMVFFTGNQFLGIPLDGTFYGAANAFLGIAGVAALVYRRERVRDLLRKPVLPDELGRGFGLLLFAVLVGFLLFVLYKGLIVWPAHADELIYHMEIPKVAWQTGSLPVRPGLDPLDQSTAYPDLLVTQQLWVYLGAGAFDTVLVRPIVPVYTVLLAMLVFFDARRWFGLVAAALATAALFCIASFAALSLILLDDVPVAFFGYLAFRFAVDAILRGTSWVPAGLFGGFAALVKYDGLAAFVALGAAMLLIPLWTGGAHGPNERRWTWKGLITKGIPFFGIGIVPALPVLMRNTLVLGNPVYPYFFGGVDTALPASILSKLTAPSTVNAIRGFEATALLTAVPVAAMLLGILRVRAWSRIERFVILVVVLYLPLYLYYPLPSAQIRYLAPVLPAMSVFAGRQISWWLQESTSKPRSMGILLFLALLASAVILATELRFTTGFIQGYALQSAEIFTVSSIVIVVLVRIRAKLNGDHAQKAVAISMILVLLAPGVVGVAAEQWDPRWNAWQPNLLPQSEDAYLSQQLGADWRMWKWMNANLPDNTTVLSFEPRAFYLAARILPASSPLLTPTYNMTLRQALAYVKNLGVRYLLDSAIGDSIFINEFFWERSVLFQNLADGSAFVSVHSEDSTTLYRLV